MNQSRHLEKLEHFKAWNADAAELALAAARDYEPAETLTPAPTFAKVSPQKTASWASDDNLYLVVTQTDQALLRKIL